MILTEEEAKKKSCPRPFFELDLLSETYSNEAHTGRTEYRQCIASVCMAWRWTKEYENCRRCSGTGNAPPSAARDYCGPERTVECDTCSGRGTRKVDDKRGYCGLAGSPE